MILSQKKSGNQNACVNQIDISSIEGDVDIISVSFIVAPFSKNDKCWQAFFFLVYFFPFFIFAFRWWEGGSVHDDVDDRRKGGRYYDGR